MITAFHPSPTFSVRFVPVLVLPAGEKVHATGEKRYLRGAWCLWDQHRGSGQGWRYQGPADRLAGDP
jgi:hypothetical protein